MPLSSPANPPVSSAMPLPPDVVGHASWFGRARQFPIFGLAWFGIAAWRSWRARA